MSTRGSMARLCRKRSPDIADSCASTTLGGSRSRRLRHLHVRNETPKVNPAASFHTLRHTYAPLMVMDAVPLMVVARNLGHADTRMVEKHYGHLATSYVREAIRAAKPLGISDAGRVVPIVSAR